MSSPEQPNKRGTGRQTSSGDETQRPDDANSADFGSFVSSSVKNSFRQLKRESERTPAPDADEGTPRTPRAGRSRQRPSTSEPPIRTGPVGRKWRDAVASTQPRAGSEDLPGEDDEQRTPDDEGGGFDLGGWFRETFFDENGPNRKLIAAIIALILLIILIIYLLSQGGDGNGGNDDTTPTATTPNVITTDRTGTPPTEDDDSTPPRQSGPQTPEPSPTAGVNQGGDNQRD
jgi:hypothetical protein